MVAFMSKVLSIGCVLYFASVVPVSASIIPLGEIPQEIEIAKHGEIAFDLQNIDARTAIDLEVQWIGGTRIGGGTPDGKFFKQADVSRNGELLRFHLAGDPDGGVAGVTPGVEGGIVNLIFLESFTAGSKFKVNFSYGQQTTGYVGPYSERVQPVPIPAAMWLMGSALAGLVGIGARNRGVKG